MVPDLHLRPQRLVAAIGELGRPTEKVFPRDGATHHGAGGAGAVARAAVQDAPVVHDEEPPLLHVHRRLERLVGGARTASEV